MNNTTLEQSKKLIELGLDPNTADMHIISYSDDRGGYFTTSLCYSKWDAEHTEGYFPCWSLGALFHVIPTKIGKNLDYWLTMETTTACNYVLFYKNVYSNEEICLSSKNKNLLDSAIGLIEKLIQEGFLNTKGENDNAMTEEKIRNIIANDRSTVINEIIKKKMLMILPKEL